MNCTLDQYIALSKLEKWWRKYNHQIITIDSRIGCGVLDLIHFFTQKIGLDDREIVYLSSNQKQVLHLAYLKLHAYYTDGFLYTYKKLYDIDTLEAVNKHSSHAEFEWIQKFNKKIDSRYKLIIVFDSTLLTKKNIRDLQRYGLPIILLEDTKLLPAHNSYTYKHDANITITELHPWYMNNPIVHFANKISNKEQLKIGNYDGVNIIGKSKLNSYNMKSSDMIITLNEDTRNLVNKIYREKILNTKNNITKLGERIILTESMYGHVLENPDEERIKIYLRKNMVTYIDKINKHALITKWVPSELKLDYYHEPFEDMSIDRYYLNNIDGISKQIMPDNIIKCQYAYALTPDIARYNTWDKVLLMLEPSDYEDSLYDCLLYTAITRAEKFVNIVI